MTAKTRVDWWRVITDLSRKGYTTRGLAKAVGMPKSGISMLRNGVTGRPRYEDGEAILAIWMAAMKKTQGDVPRLLATPSVSASKR